MKKLSRKREKKDLTKGSRNLVLLGLFSTLIALTTTGVALAIYHNSGDIYLDRSRPGFLPDEEEIEQIEQEPEDEEYEFNKNTKLTNEDIDEFLENLKTEIKAINAYEKPFSSDVLSDERLGIPLEEEKSDTAGDSNESNTE